MLGSVCKKTPQKWPNSSPPLSRGQACFAPRNDKSPILVSLRAPDLILRMHAKENRPTMSLRRSRRRLRQSQPSQYEKPFIFLGAIRRIAWQSQLSRRSFFNKPLSRHDSIRRCSSGQADQTFTTGSAEDIGRRCGFGCGDALSQRRRSRQPQA